MANSKTDFDSSLDAVWKTVEDSAIGSISSPNIAYKYATKGDPYALRCQSLSDYTLLVTAQQSIDAFVLWHYEHFDKFQLQFVCQEDNVIS